MDKKRAPLPIFKTRLENLKALLQGPRFNNSHEAFRAATGKSLSQIGQWLTGHRNIGERVARELEAKLALPLGYFDRAPGSPTPAAQPASPYGVRADVVLIARRLEHFTVAQNRALLAYLLTVGPAVSDQDVEERMLRKAGFPPDSPPQPAKVTVATLEPRDRTLKPVGQRPAKAKPAAK